MSKSIQVLIIPWGIIIWSIIVILVVAGIFFWKHLKVKKLIENCEEYILGPNEDILSIAASRNIDWKKLAKINKLTPPYILKEGSILFVPKKESATIPLYDPNITPPVSTEVKKDPDPNSEK